MATIPAEVVSIDVEVGDYVNEGDVLFTLDPSNVESQATQAEFGLEQANAALSQANVGIKNANASINSAQLGYDMAVSNYNVSLDQYNFSVENLSKYEELYNEGIVSEMEYEQMKLQANPETLELLKKQVEQAEQGLEQAQLAKEQANAAYSQANVGVKQAQDAVNTASDTIDDLVVTAPVSGYITLQALTENAIASNASVAMLIDELKTIKVSANVTANQVGKVAIGDTVDVYISALDKSFEGRVEMVSLTADARTLLYPITVSVNNPNIEIKPGMFATVRLIDQEEKSAIVVPTEAVVVRNGKDVVFVYDGNDKAVMTPVEVGADDGYSVQIKSGISSGDIVVTNGVGLIDQDTTISVVRGDE